MRLSFVKYTSESQRKHLPVPLCSLKRVQTEDMQLIQIYCEYEIVTFE